MGILSNYTELQDEVTSLCHREGDTAFTAKLPLFVKLAEARFNRELRTTDQLTSMATTALSSGAANLPTGFLAWAELRFDGAVDHTLQPKSLEWIRAQDDAAGGDPQYFAVIGSQVVCWPPTGSIKGTYFKEIPDLATNSTNWLLTAHPDLYLFATLAEAALWTGDMGNLSVWADRAKATMDRIQRTDDENQFNGGVLAIRAR